MKKFLIVVGVLFVLLVGCGALFGDSETKKSTPAPAATSAAPAETAAPKAAAKPKKAPAPPIAVTAQVMAETLEANAMSAKNTYEDKRVAVTGVVGSIDASGEYFSLDSASDPYTFTNIQVQTSDKFKDQVAAFTKGQPITVTGKVTNVGEFMGYTIKAESIQ